MRIYSKVKTDPRSTSGSGPTPTITSKGSPLAHAYHVW